MSWRVDGYEVRNPQGKIVLWIPETLTSIEYRETVARIIDAPAGAYRRGLEEGAERGDVALELPEEDE